MDKDWKLQQIRSLLRFFSEVDSLCSHIRRESGFDGDTTAYLEILSAKEEAELIRRVSHTRVLRQVHDVVWSVLCYSKSGARRVVVCRIEMSYCLVHSLYSRGGDPRSGSKTVVFYYFGEGTLSFALLTSLLIFPVTVRITAIALGCTSRSLPTDSPRWAAAIVAKSVMPPRSCGFCQLRMQATTKSAKIS